MWYDMIWCDVIWYDMIWYDMIWHDMIWYDMIWYDMIWYDMIWYDMIQWKCLKNCQEKFNRVGLLSRKVSQKGKLVKEFCNYVFKLAFV